MTTLRAGLDLRELLMRAAEVGASFVADALAEAARKTVHGEIAAGSFEPLPDRIGPYGVRQEAGLLQIATDDLTNYPAVAQLRLDLVEVVHEHGQGIPGLGGWLPNDIAAMRCHTGSLGITPHRDNKRYRHLIAIVTVDGSAAFTHCADREGTVIDRWQTVPASLVLLGAPGQLRGRGARFTPSVARPAVRGSPSPSE